ncbi:redoxin domain-containing protein [Planococcus lenghuensis]|uniref:Thiol-disulfide oxidoreductase n=1 Tax=Planococcus lenghuensis TaxID=2213202 RepID=A0A1Q2L1L6_9BACL|nr:redoxin domain-containing protein [Planococcus lenghuensis]AQQ53937.1 thiol-disulfide oxidoreductase [Planococcus lenghuensis]
MAKKVFGLLLLAGLIVYFIVGIVQDRLEKNELIPADDLGSVVEFSAAGGAGLAAGEPAPDFRLQSLGGETIRLSDYRGQAVVLNFWASWCEPCKKEMPEMQNYYEGLAADADVEILAVNLTDQDSGLDKVNAFVQEYGLTFPIPLDEEGQVREAYGILTIPTTFLINEEGRLVTQIRGPLSNDMLEELVSGLAEEEIE